MSIERILNQNSLTQVITGNFAGSLGECGTNSRCNVSKILFAMRDKLCLQCETNIVCNVRQIHTLSSVMIVNTRWSTLQSNQKRFHQTNPSPLDGSPQCGSTSGLGSNKVNPPPKSDRGHCLWTTV